MGKRYRFIRYYSFLMALTYFATSLIGNTWDPMKWTIDAKGIFIFFIIINLLLAGFAWAIVSECD